VFRSTLRAFGGSAQRRLMVSLRFASEKHLHAWYCGDLKSGR